MLALKDFEKHLNFMLLEKGRKYHQNGSVISLDEAETGHWFSEVEGMQVYKVEIHLKNNRVVSNYFCTCPTTDGLCKHIIAVLFSIREVKENKRSGPAKTMNFEDLLQDISLKEYQDFIRHYASGRGTFKREFELWFASKVKGFDVSKKYQELIKKVIRKYERDGFVDYKNTWGLSHEVNKMLDTGSVHLAGKSYGEAFWVAKAVLISMIEVMAYSDDSNANISSVIHDAIEMIDTIVNEGSSEKLKEEVFEFLLQELNYRIYFDFGDFGYNLVVLLSHLSIKLNKSDSFLHFIDNMIARPVSGLDSYSRDFFKLQKIEYLKLTGQLQELEKLVQQNMDMVEVRQQEVEKAMAVKDTVTATKLILEGIKIAERKGHAGTVEHWKMELLRIAIREKDIKEIRRYSKHFAFDRGFNREYYKQWKKTYAGDDWNRVIEEEIAERTPAN